MPNKFNIAKHKLEKSLLQLDDVLVYIDELEKEKDYYKDELKKAFLESDFKPYSGFKNLSTKKTSSGKKGT